MVIQEERKKTLTFVPQTGEKAYYILPYKEPLIPLETGFGYPGVVLVNDEDKVQCHFCGNWYKEITGMHVINHGFKDIADFKQEFSLAQGTVLTSESTRLAMAIAGVHRLEADANLMIRLSKLAPKKVSGSKNGRKTSSFQNKKGTCNAQLIASLKAYSVKFGKSMTKADIMSADSSLIGNLKNRFGSYQNALMIAEITPNKFMATRMATREMVIEEIKNFYKQYHRVPFQTDFKRGLLTCGVSRLNTLFGSYGKAITTAGFEPRPRAYVASYLPALDVIKRYSSGETVDQLSKSYCCSDGLITELLKHNGIRIRHTNMKRERIRIRLPVNDIIELYQNGYTIEMLAKKYLTSWWSISELLKDNNIKIWATAPRHNEDGSLTNYAKKILGL